MAQEGGPADAYEEGTLMCTESVGKYMGFKKNYECGFAEESLTPDKDGNFKMKCRWERNIFKLTIKDFLPVGPIEEEGNPKKEINEGSFGHENDDMLDLPPRPD